MFVSLILSNKLYLSSGCKVYLVNVFLVLKKKIFTEIKTGIFLEEVDLPCLVRPE